LLGVVGVLHVRARACQRELCATSSGPHSRQRCCAVRCPLVAEAREADMPPKKPAGEKKEDKGAAAAASTAAATAAQAAAAAAAAASAAAGPAALGETEPEVDERKARIRAAFAIFDPDNTGSVVEEEVPTIMRYLDVFVSDKDFVEKVAPELQGDEPSAFVTYARLEKKVMELMDSHEYDPDPGDILLAAFRVRAWGGGMQCSTAMLWYIQPAAVRCQRAMLHRHVGACGTELLRG
jgi:hypothetical protein